MIDCGTRTPEALAKLGHPVTNLQNYVITHSHADHIGGLEEVMLMGRYVTKKRPHIIITPDYEKKLWTDSLKGGATWNETRKSSFLGFRDYWEVHHPRTWKGLNRLAWAITYAGFHLIIFRTMHYPDTATSWKNSAFSTGLIIDKRIFFSGDTRFDRELIEDVSSKFDIEYYIHDVQFFPAGVHAFFEDLKSLPADIKRRTMLTHYPDNFRNFEDDVKAAGFLGFTEQQKYYDFE